MTKKTRIYLVRHGEIAGSGVFRYNGQTDVPLTQQGLDQYHLLAERLSDKPVSACYTSDLSRCVRGARILCGRWGLEPVLKKELRELSFGTWEGKTWNELAEGFPEEWQARMNDLVGYRVPGGENLCDLHSRLIPEVERIIGRHQGEEVLVVGHGGSNRVILLSALGAPLSSMFRIEQDYGCLNIIDYYADGHPVVKLLNG
ncbi:MAG: alpha-ribazole phosphatase [Geobacteraceae bacterium]|nr:alpha-ribazole phosphatase [Geobacteraceae bacterium]